MGHAVVERILHSDPVHKVTIISRGMALGYTMALPTEDRYLVTRPSSTTSSPRCWADARRAADLRENTTTGASNDIGKATDLARHMVTEWGMSDKLGPLAFGKRDEMVFLGRDIGEQRNYSEESPGDRPGGAPTGETAFHRAKEVLRRARGRAPGPRHKAHRGGDDGGGRDEAHHRGVRGPAGDAGAGAGDGRRRRLSPSGPLPCSPAAALDPPVHSAPRRAGSEVVSPSLPDPPDAAGAGLRPSCDRVVRRHPAGGGRTPDRCRTSPVPNVGRGSRSGDRHGAGPVALH